MDLLLNLAPVVAFLVIHEFFRRLNSPWMAFAFMVVVFAVLWLDLLSVGLFHKLFPSFPTVLVIVVTVLVLGFEAWDWRKRSRSQQ